MTTASRVVFGLLVVASVGAFFLAQRVKSTPAAVARFSVSPVCSPNGDGRFDGCRAAFLLKKGDDVTVRVVGRDDEVVDTLVSDRSLPAFRNLRVLWRGHTAEGGRARDGTYHFEIALRRQGRSILLPRPFRVDTTPPRPVVAAIGPTRDKVPRPELFPNPQGKPLQIHVRSPSTTRPTTVEVWRTDPRPSAEPVATLKSLKGSGTVTWDGTVRGRRVQPGTYVVAVRTRDRAGNIGSSPAVLPPKPGYGQTLPGHGGITVRYLGVQPPLDAPIVTGEKAPFGVDARRAAYTWSVRHVGEARPRKRGSGTRPNLTIAAPGRRSGLYVLQVRTRRHATTVPFAVQGLHHERVLVVLPALLWQGTNPVDDDGDGLPNTLTRGVSVLRDRVLGRGLPDDLVRRVAPLLIFLDHSQLRYDLTTDLALAAGVGPPLDGHRGVVLAGDERWLPSDVARGLAAYVRRGGRLATFGTDSLRRTLRLTARRLLDPTTAAPTDALGFEVRPLVRRPTTLTAADDRIDLFRGDVFGGTGVFSGLPSFEPIEPPPGARVLARATTPDGTTGILAARVGRGLAIRVGLPDLPSRLSHPGNETALVKRIWELLAA
ncbi:MAG: hypothetical protein E6G10_26280 [Actinobacteria bacterium]|nr:MAG: hypothetical protein E6G10_26280 [Actinomycetota bacterium]